MRSLFEFWTYSNLHISASALSFAAVSTYFIPELQITTGLALLIFGSTLCSYVFHRLYPIIKHHRISTDGALNIWTNKYKRLQSFVFLIGIIISGAGFFMIHFNTKIVLLILAGITFLYSFPFYNYGNVKIRLRDFPFIKIFLIALIWALVCVILPAAESEFQMANANLWKLFIAHFLFIFAITIPFDIRDLEYDRSVDVKTIPLVFGVGKSLIISIAMLITATIIYLSFDLNFNARFATTITMFISSIFILNAYERKHDLYYLFWMDGLMFLFYLLLMGFN